MAKEIQKQGAITLFQVISYPYINLIIIIILYVINLQ